MTSSKPTKRLIYDKLTSCVQEEQILILFKLYIGAATGGVLFKKGAQ